MINKKIVSNKEVISNNIVEKKDDSPALALASATYIAPIIIINPEIAISSTTHVDSIEVIFEAEQQNI